MLAKYRNAFPKDIDQRVDSEISDCELRLQNAGITLLPREQAKEMSQSTPSVKVVKFERGAAVVTYQVVIGRFTMEVVMLNLAYKSNGRQRRVI